MEAFPKPVTKSCTKIIYEQMSNYLYTITENNEIGYFIRIRNNQNRYIVLVTNSCILRQIKNDSLTITLDNKQKSIELGNIRYEDKKNGIAMIEIKENENSYIN